MLKTSQVLTICLGGIFKRRFNKSFKFIGFDFKYPAGNGMWTSYSAVNMKIFRTFIIIEIKWKPLKQV